MQVLLSFEEVPQEVAHEIELGVCVSAVVLQGGSSPLIEVSEGRLKLRQSPSIELSIERLFVVLELPVLTKDY